MVILFQDDFATTQIVNNALTGWPTPPNIYRPETVGFSTDIFHSAGRSLKVTAPGALPSGRSTRILQYRYESEYWGLGSFYFPVDFVFTSLNKYLSFISFFSEYIDGQNVYATIAQLWGDNLELVIARLRVKDGVEDIREYIKPKIFIERGKWFTLMYHVVRDETNGLFELWKDGTKIIDWSGMTKFLQERFDWIPILHGCSTDESIKTVYFDDVALADAPFPTPTTYNVIIASTPIEVPVIINGAPVGSTPITASLVEGSHTIEVPREVNV
ncbi:hypothetical protein ES702_00364 [subsurface metagenome]